MVAAAGSGRRGTAVGSLSGVCGLRIPCVFSFCATERGDSGERKKKIEVMNIVKTTTMYVGGGGDMASEIVWQLLQHKQMTSGIWGNKAWQIRGSTDGGWNGIGMAKKRWEDGVMGCAASGCAVSAMKAYP